MSQRYPEHQTAHMPTSDFVKRVALGTVVAVVTSTLLYIALFIIFAILGAVLGVSMMGL